MFKPDNYEKAKAVTFGENTQLEAGGYVVSIVNAYETTSQKGNSMLVLLLDIVEGEYAHFFTKQHALDAGKEWGNGGIMRLMLPSVDAEVTDWKLRRFKGFIKAIEESNPSFHWNWDERSLVRCVAGCLFRREEFIGQDGVSRFSTKPFMVISADRIREGRFSVPTDKLLPREQKESTGFIVNDDWDKKFTTPADEQPLYPIPNEEIPF